MGERTAEGSVKLLPSKVDAGDETFENTHQKVAVEVLGTGGCRHEDAVTASPNAGHNDEFSSFA